MKTLPASSPILHTALWLLSTAAIFGAPDSSSTRLVRILAVGESPPYRQEIRDGVSVEVPPSPDSIPPREVIVGNAGKGAKPIALSLGKISEAVRISAGVDRIDLRLAGEAPDAAPWLILENPASGDTLVCLFRNPAKPTWKDVLSVMVPDGAKDAPAGTLRIINLYSLPAKVDWAGEMIEVPAGKVETRQIKPDAGVPVKIEAADGAGKTRRYFSGEVTQKADERGWIVIHGADQPGARRPVNVLVLREKVLPSSP